MVDRVASRIDNVASKWWLLLLRGLAAIVVGIVAFVHPGDTLVAMVIVLGAYACFVGILAIVTAISGFGGDHWWALLLEGIVALVAAGIIWSWPIASTLAFVYFVAAWLIVSGILQVAGGVRLHEVINNEWIYILSGSHFDRIWCMDLSQWSSGCRCYGISAGMVFPALRNCGGCGGLQAPVAAWYGDNAGC